ncbi:hypothetical protein [Sulfolobus acidocaldarius]|uniref:hypothetical protein n=1 Tax=Sulfolobus acidocaldarius TaxID=2285 RepID=UPI00078535D5|nr:hypothetical protein [Sulfolobus acidocaldarius]
MEVIIHPHVYTKGISIDSYTKLFGEFSELHWSNSELGEKGLRAIEPYKDVRSKIVILFGTYGIGDYTDDSDVNLLVISRYWLKDHIETFGTLYRIWRHKVILTHMTVNIFLNRFRACSIFVLKIWRMETLITL